MHFHLATVLLLVPLLTAAPTPNLEQRVPCGAPTSNLERRVPCGDTAKKEPLGGHLPELPIGNARRQTSSGLPDTIVDALVAIAHSQDDQKREEPKGVTDTLASTLAGLTEPLGGDVPVLPVGNAKRQSSGLPDTIVDALVAIAKSRPDEKRDSENPTDAVAAVLGTITGGLGKAGGKRQAPDASTDILADVLKQVTAAMEETKDQSPEPSRKRQSDDPAAALSALLGMLTGAAGKAGGAKAKRFGVDVVGIAKDAVVDKVIGAASGST
ncbi:hypothetical protein V498_03502 [Pseudogymnoascus sp. VKM F-4517 (FW-2822)]|nr:hypothetical protein V498_03502 [Pseudogymnoascus sp. VKM F-4517 (FW-2822)]